MIALYMDHHVPSAITKALQKRGVDVLTAYQDKGHHLDDSKLLDRAAELRRVLFTQDEDFIVEAAQRQAAGTYFVGILFGSQALSYRVCIQSLEFIAKAGNPKDFENQLQFLPF